MSITTTNYKINSTDLSNVFLPYQSTAGDAKITVGYQISGVDIGQYFHPYKTNILRLRSE